MDNYGVPAHFLTDLVKAEKRANDIRQSISETACRNAGIKEGEIMRHKFAGLFYEVRGFHAYVNNGRVQISVQAYRHWKTGRKAGRTAYTSSFLSFSDLEKVEAE